ncbi:LysM peptidoglycan-binding domain-containing protein [Acinetobacter lwoffii]|uniref:LysM peptidoglycan-binding domain-containing protein n=1 Tax=Acinetobacter lwoffii TaxID=28090 RepID=A0A6N1MR38_ACILW|nr:LysM peptidoglycan-binding domain-containing protein [Acinetobacter lwoffii]MCO8070939.1 LysM peptidoglycan-binding domain-containing protein [Acinetobacter lwoffii]QKU20352.1 LysM peptidoglycan-binding domain-containing protein [Acinetobacter lwoffii]
MTNKSLATVQILDLLGNPIPKVQYEVKNSKTGQHVVRGSTNSKGCLYEIQRDKGTVLDIYVKSLLGGGMKKVQTFIMAKDRMLVTVISPKILLDLKTLENNENKGSYKRKTHKVKKGETLSSIAQQYHTTIRVLERLNGIKDVNKISIGQVIKLPINMPATGNNTSIDRKPNPQKNASQNNKSQSSEKSKKETKQADKGIVNTVEEYEKKALEQLNEWYEEGKKALSDAIKIDMKEDRSQDGGTPKTDTSNLCKTNPQCISQGKSELIREVNIRLAGFGGALPTDEFTPLTAECIKQFQRDYMGVPETGKICGIFLAALDKFRDEYGIANFMTKASCPCGQCSGYGNNRRGIKSGLNTANEYPGLHRSLIWILKALNFYLKNEFKYKGLEVAYIESGYRCINDNKKKGRTTVNHMGLALDIHINKNGKRTKAIEDIEFIRKKIMTIKMRASEERASDKIYLEPKKFKSGANGATTWVHFDVTRFSNIYFNDEYFKKEIKDLNGNPVVEIIKSLNMNSILNCAGIIVNTSTISKITDQTIEALVKELGDAIASGEGSYEAWNAGAPEGKRVKYGKMNDLPGTITEKTIDEILDAAKKYRWDDNRRRFATGKYQTIPSTLAAAKARLNLSGNELYDPAMQERVFKEHLLRGRSSIYSLIIKGDKTVEQAMVDASKEWASIALPKGEKNKYGIISDGSIGYHESKTNKANKHSTEKVKVIFEKIHAYHSNK